MNNAQKFNRFIERNPHPHSPFFRRPQLDRRAFFKLTGAGITGSFMALAGNRTFAAEAAIQANVTTKNTAKNVIFLMLDGGPSQMDTFDLKITPGVTRTDILQPERIGGVMWPVGLMPKLAMQLDDLAIIRSMRSWALVHEIGREWLQIGRNPNAREAGIAPHIGSIIALEKENERTPGQVFPAFVALNADGANGPGYFSGRYAPFKISPTKDGLANATHADGAARFSERYAQLQMLDEPVKGTAVSASPLGRATGDLREFYEAANKLVHNDAVNRAFSFTKEDSDRYGANSFGDACLVAKQILVARQGTRFIQINFGTWDHHRNVYTGLPAMARPFDSAVSALINDLKASGMFNDTLIVAGGEFGRSPEFNSQAGRDHFLQQSFVLMGGGIRGGILGMTNDHASTTVEPGWSRNRHVRIEDVEATILSALGINWTTIRRDDPLGIGFPYIPFAQDDVYGPINELWDRRIAPGLPIQRGDGRRIS
ncbi:MAG: DUF1501 domain-containing protein [Blastocatellia bacterium]